MNLMHMGLAIQAASCRVSADLNSHERTQDQFAKQYANVAKRFDAGDIAAEVMDRYPDDVREIIAGAIGGDFDSPRLDRLAERALDAAVRDTIHAED